MGCDIHLAVERRNEAGQWERVLPPDHVKAPWLVEQAAKDSNDLYYKTRAERTWYDDRNYDLFAQLAGVRNGFGTIPISEPRGLPDDLSDEVRRLNDESSDDGDVWLGDHSHSWLTVAELLAYDRKRFTTQRGWVDPWNFEVWRRMGKPRGWCQSVGGGRVEHVTNDTMAAMIDNGAMQFEGDDDYWMTYTGWASRPVKSNGGSVAVESSYYTEVSWRESYCDSAKRWWDVIVPALEALGPPADTRIVFGFDS